MRITNIPQVSSKLTWYDIWGAVKVRWSVNRNNYKTDPGLYAIGNPDKNSDVFVSANYKLSFDTLRKNLDGIDAWILVLDTKGVNVWCAAGKGTFGTDELVYRIASVSLNTIIEHKRIIVPQLGAVGVSAYKVKELSGFTVAFGPVEASDIKAFITNKYRTTTEIRKVQFTFIDRLKLIPVELVYGWKYILSALLIFFILSGINKSEFTTASLLQNGLMSVLLLSSGYLSGTVFSPLFLPYLPFRSFALKGATMGVITTLVFLFFNIFDYNLLTSILWLFIITSVSSFLSMNFTGASTYTNLSGVKKEMKIAIPIQITFAAIGIILFIIQRFI